MPDNDQPSFSEDELEDIKRAAKIMGMTVDELVSHATNRHVKRVKEFSRKSIYNPKSIKILK
ncbi:hypothetical protein BTW00_05490 [Psychrobacter sp. C 20.9]|uniref:hypothetical protein n=1 Tax=Psychrobacter sp. C 20.9 TaxID=1926477 RepID=UPI000946D03E|nr:hypothetical protein [Psychrobacter sp. C 20.9]OLF36540.1 hypothetical protein BTW00_05490 [Psychrobacter sp. C 20.9]